MQLLTNIGCIWQQAQELPALRRGAELAKLPYLRDAYMLLDGDRIVEFGPMSDCPATAGYTVYDTQGRDIFPSFCDSHSHLVFAAPRQEEFVYRIQGLSYHEIAAKGGGILNSAKRLQAMPEEQLLAEAKKRLLALLRLGTGALEIKSGYGLTYEAELKMLRVIKALKAWAPIPIKATFLGAHALPPEYKENRAAYMDLLIEQLLPKIAEEGLADYIDVFCEKGFFSLEEAQRIMEAGKAYGLPAKIHCNQFNSMGAIEAAIAAGARSVDHLEVLNAEEMKALGQADTLACLLPTAPFFLNDEHRTPARKLIESGAAVVLASDYNPGTTPSGRMAFVCSLACIQLRMLPEEAINAASLHGAYAMDLEQELGCIRPGAKANFFLTEALPSLAYLPYSFGSDLIEAVFLNGKLHWEKQALD